MNLSQLKHMIRVYINYEIKILTILKFYLKVIIDNIELIIVNREPVMLMIPSNFKLILFFPVSNI